MYYIPTSADRTYPSRGLFREILFSYPPESFNSPKAPRRGFLGCNITGDKEKSGTIRRWKTAIYCDSSTMSVGSETKIPSKRSSDIEISARRPNSLIEMIHSRDPKDYIKLDGKNRV